MRLPPLAMLMPREDEPDVVLVEADASPLDFLCSVFRDPRQPMARRLKAAIEAAKFVHPTFRASAVVSFDGIAERLEAAIERSGKVLSAAQRAEE